VNPHVVEVKGHLEKGRIAAEIGAQDDKRAPVPEPCLQARDHREARCC